MMKVGGEYKIFLPSTIAYPVKQAGLGRTALVHEIELLSIEKPSVPLMDTNTLTPKFPPFINRVKKPKLPSVVAGGRSLPEGYKVVQNTTITLGSIEGAARSFVDFYNNILPFTKKKDIKEMCDEVAAADFKKECRVFLEKRLSDIKQMPVESARFTVHEVKKKKGSMNLVAVTWKEQLTLKKNMKATNTMTLVTRLQRDGDVWKVNKIVTGPVIY